jgi:hypothetical protein
LPCSTLENCYSCTYARISASAGGANIILDCRKGVFIYDTKFGRLDKKPKFNMLPCVFASLTETNTPYSPCNQQGLLVEW